MAKSNLTGFSEVSEAASQKTRTQSVVGGYMPIDFINIQVIMLVVSRYLRI